jgi:protein-disulfide isomerase
MHNRFKAAALSLALSFPLVSTYALSADLADYTPAQQARIGQIAADYLLAHPEILIDVSKKLQAKQDAMKARVMTQATLRGHRLLMMLNGVPVKGPADSKVVVTEFFDYECIACSMMAPVMEQVMANNPGVRFAFRDWTIFAGRYPESTQASHRGLNIWKQKGSDAYMAYHNGIYRTGHNEGKLTVEDIEKVATFAGTVAENVENRAQIDSIIEGNNTLAELLELKGTPGIIVMPAENATAENITVIPGVVSADVMQQAIDKAMK